MQAWKLSFWSTGPTTAKSPKLFPNSIICIEVIENVLAHSKFLPAQHKIYQPWADGLVLASIPDMVLAYHLCKWRYPEIDTRCKMMSMHSLMRE